MKATSLPLHLRDCPQMIVKCGCGVNVARDMMKFHQQKDCSIIEIQCDVIDCNAKFMRRDHKKHQDDNSNRHMQLLSTKLNSLLAEVVTVKQANIKLLNDIVNVKAANEFLILNQANEFKAKVKLTRDNFAASVSTLIFALNTSLQRNSELVMKTT
jgi:hypothetical protein